MKERGIKFGMGHVWPKQVSLMGKILGGASFVSLVGGGGIGDYFC